MHDCWKPVKTERQNDAAPADSTKAKTIPKSKKKKGVKMYQRFWQLANERVEERKDIKTKARMVRETFRVQVLAELQSLDSGDRRYSHKTPSKKLKLDKRCEVSPPYGVLKTIRN